MACKGKEAPPPTPTPTTPPADASVAAFDWPRCEKALRAAPALPPSKRAMAIIEGCEPCGSWAPILGWQTSDTEFRALEQAMIACEAFCDATGKQRFLGTVDEARHKQTRTPWRELGEYCKASVSAVPDARYVNAPWFALDRIARAVGKRADVASLLTAITIPLPAVTVSGVGPALAEAPVAKPEVVPAQITVTLADVSVGATPTGALTAQGITVTGDAYPGTTTALPALAAALEKLGGRAAVFAPAAMTATRIAEVVAAAKPHTLHLAVATRTGPPGWAMHGIVPIALVGTRDKAGVTVAVGASPDAAVQAIKAAPVESLKRAPVTLMLGKDATVTSLATVLGALAYLEVPAAALVPAKA